MRRTAEKPRNETLDPCEPEPSVPEIAWVRLHPKAQGPEKASAGASCYDLRACLERPIHVNPLQVCAIPTGIALVMPAGWEAQIRPRSGLALKDRVTLINSPGTVDSDYTGEVQILLLNLGPTAFVVKPGERIAQMKLQYGPPCALVEGEALPETDRGSGGFGSTGRE